MTAASKAMLVIGFPLAGPTCFAITSSGAVPGDLEKLALGSLWLEMRLRGDAERLEVSSVFPDGPDDTSELVGQADGGLVVFTAGLELQSPGA
jgi:hypothetical protein